MGRRTDTAPLLVTGLPRSGTSWTGKMLQAGGGVVYVNEPLNPAHPPGRSPGVLDAVVEHQYQYICPDNDARWAAAFADTVGLRYHPVAELRANHGGRDIARMAKYGTAFASGRLRGHRALLDDPYALLSTMWFVERLGCRAIILVRDPVALAGSWHRLGWRPAPRALVDQPLLVRDVLDGDTTALYGDGDGDGTVTATAALWRRAYRYVATIRDRSPRLRICRYEDLARDPLTGFRELYEFCGLPWSTRAANRIRRASMTGTAGRRGFAWSLRGGPSRTAFRPMDARASLNASADRLTGEQIDTVRSVTAQVADLFYPSVDPR